VRAAAPYLEEQVRAGRITAAGAADRLLAVFDGLDPQAPPGT
jgi:hypothetical protein